MTKRARTGEQGLSVLEALIVTAIAAMLVVLLLPLAPRGMQRDYAVAQAALASTQALRAETAFQSILRGFVPPPAGGGDSPVRGNRVGLVGVFAASEDSACARTGLAGDARLYVQREGAGGRLICEVSGARSELLRWDEGVASFAYGDGATWRETWPAGARSAPSAIPQPSRSVLVRFRLSSRARSNIEWVGRAGAVEPPPELVVVPPADAPADTTP